MKKILPFLLIPFALLSPKAACAVASAPDKVEGVRAANGLSFRVSWSSPAFRTDGNLLNPGEISSYKVIRTNALTGGTTSVVFTVAAASPTTYNDSTISGRTFFYRVRAVDAVGTDSPDSTYVSSDLNSTAYFLAADSVSYASVPGTFKAALDAEGTALRGMRLTSLEGNRIYKSIKFYAVDILTNQTRENYILSSPASFSIAYLLGGDGIVVSASPIPLPAVSYPDAAGSKSAFSMFWDNGAEFVKVGSSVDTTNKVATASSRLLGSYQLRLVSQSLSSQLNAVYPRTITPNNDGINDRVFFLFENPSLAAAGGSIYDSQSAKVADLRSTDLFGGDTVLFWDGTDESGAVVSGGFYIYKLQVGEKNFSGTVAVAR